MDFDWAAYRGNYVLVSLVSPPDLEVAEVLGYKPTFDSINRFANFMSNKRDPESLTILRWYPVKKRYVPVSHPFPGTYEVTADMPVLATDRQNTETAVRQLQKKRLTKEQIADQLLKEGGYDADDIGAALERVFGREHRTKSQLPSYKP